jgi:hypothetical protein
VHSVDIPSASQLPNVAAFAIVEEITTIHANYFWHVAKGVQYGIEYQVKEVTANQGVFLDSSGNPILPLDPTLIAGQSDKTGEAARLQFTGRYKF